MLSRGYLWTDLTSEVSDLFASLVGVDKEDIFLPGFRSIRLVADVIQFSKWNTQELDRLPEKWRAKAIWKARSDWQRLPSKPKATKRRPRVPPAPSQWVINHRKRAEKQAGGAK